MKKIFLSLFLVLTLCTSYAHFPISVKTEEGKGAVSSAWSLLQMGIFPHRHFQIFSEKTDIFGLALALGMLNQESAIISFAPINALDRNLFLQCGVLLDVTTHNYALSIAPLLNLSGRNYGVQIGLFNMENNFGYRPSDDRAVPGLQAGIFNIGGGFQIGLLNWNEQGFLPCFPIFNFAVGRK